MSGEYNLADCQLPIADLTKLPFAIFFPCLTPSHLILVPFSFIDYLAP